MEKDLLSDLQRLLSAGACWPHPTKLMDIPICDIPQMLFLPSQLKLVKNKLLPFADLSALIKWVSADCSPKTSHSSGQPCFVPAALGVKSKLLPKTWLCIPLKDPSQPQATQPNPTCKSAFCFIIKISDQSRDTALGSFLWWTKAWEVLESRM